MGIQTPWEFLTNMAIETIVAIQSEDSIFMTDFQITYKQMRFAASTTITATPLSGTGTNVQTIPFGAGAYLPQAAPPTNLGNIPGSPSIVSLSNPANTSFAGVF